MVIQKASMVTKINLWLYKKASVVIQKASVVIQKGICGYTKRHLWLYKRHFVLLGRSKTLMFFDGCDPTLGCCVTLRGGPVTELKKVK